MSKKNNVCCKECAGTFKDHDNEEMGHACDNVFCDCHEELRFIASKMVEKYIAKKDVIEYIDHMVAIHRKIIFIHSAGPFDWHEGQIEALLNLKNDLLE